MIYLNWSKEMINFGKFLFATAPRTGTTWFMKCAFLAGFGESFKTKVHEPFSEDERGGPIRLSMVRHPADWLLSYYVAIYPGSTGVEVVDQLLTLPGDTWDEFSYTYTERMPGHIGEIFDAYKANSVLRLEDAPWNVIEMFDSFRPLNRDQIEKIRDLGKQNNSKELPFMGRQVRQLICIADRKIMDRYDY